MMKGKRNSQRYKSRREFLKQSLYAGLNASLAGSLLLSSCGKRKRYAKNTNVVFISIDTMRADHISCYGYKKELTPNIDQLAMQAHRFTSAYTTMPTTLPAHASLLSSLYPRQLSVRRNGETVPVEATMLAEVLQAAGYSTAAFVSSVTMNARYGLNQGFQTYDDAGQQGFRPANESLKAAISWLDKHNNEPFFLFLHLYDPHTPYYAPKDFRTRFGAPHRPMPPPEIGIMSNPKMFTAELIRESIAAYDAEIAYADWAVGKFMERLNQLRLDENTIVVLLSDHGESLDELITRYGYAFDHGEFLYNYELQIPLLIRIPENLSQKQNVHTTPVSIVDIMPTILETLDIEPPDTIAGISLVPVLRGQKGVRNAVFSERRKFQKVPTPYLGDYDFSGYDFSIIENEWHFIFSTVRESELYNLAQDPHEVSNLKHEIERSRKLKNKIQHWHKQTKPFFGPTKFEIDKQMLERLRSLGYTE
jgi:arylsulfatase A-like enzyme